MFGIDDLFIWVPYVIGFCCVIFAIVYGLKNWHKEDKHDNTPHP